jgi:flagellar hook-associated protein 3 FlgL
MYLPIQGDLAQSHVLRRQTAATRAEVNSLANDAGSGIATDLARHLRGQTAAVAAIQTSLARLDVFDQNLSRLATRAEAMQAALARVDRAATDAAADLQQSAEAGGPALDIAAKRGRAAFADAVNALNTRFGDQSLFAGTAINGASLLAPDALLAAARSAIAPATAPGDIATALDQWLNDPGGFTATAFLGRTDATEVPVADDRRIALDLTAADPAFRGTMKGLILAALMSDPGLAPDRTTQAAFARIAAGTLSTTGDDRIAAASRLGVIENRIATAQSRNSAERGALGIARADLIAVDAYDVATRLSDAETRLETLYALTARLSGLTLVGFLR